MYRQKCQLDKKYAILLYWCLLTSYHPSSYFIIRALVGTLAAGFEEWIHLSSILLTCYNLTQGAKGQSKETSFQIKIFQVENVKGLVQKIVWKKWSEYGYTYFEEEPTVSASWLDVILRWREREGDSKGLSPRHLKVRVDSERKQVEGKGRKVWFCKCWMWNVH